jgi:integrase
MPFRRRKDRGTWLIDFRIAGVRYRHAVPGSLSREQVKAEEERLRAAARAAGQRIALGPTVGQAIERYWNEHGKRLASWRSERTVLTKWSAALGHDVPIMQVTRDDIARIAAGWRGSLSARGRPLSDSSVNRRLDVLQRLWGRAEELWAWELARVPWRRLKLAEPAPRPRAPTAEQLEAYLAALPERSRAISQFMALTGLRLGGCRTVTRASIDMANMVIHATSKGRAGGKPTTVPITAPVAALLEQIRPWPDVGCIFRVTTKELRLDRERAREQVELPEFRSHDLRHAFSQMLEDAGEGQVISDALHHSNPHLRRRYAAARVEVTRQAIERALKR